MAWKPFGGCRLLLCLVLLALAGCQEQEQIRTYKAPRQELPEPAAARLLAVMAPHGKDVWFFKFLGSRKDVSDHEEDFDALVRSVRFQDQQETPITWTNPPGWRREPGPQPQPRYATLRLGPKGEGLEITITKLGAEAGDVRQNLDRWRDQLGLEPLNDEQFRALLNNSEMDGAKATRVDLIGVIKQEAAPKMGGRPPGQGERLPFHYTTPDGWEARPPTDKQGVPIPLVFRIKADGSEAEATAMSLAGNGGGLESNVNRWRRQVGLAPASEEQIRRDARSLEAGDVKAVYVDLDGLGLGGRKRILAAVLPHGKKETWFFTLKGPSELVEREKSRFEAFVKSIRFDGAGAAHE
ncbi:MAG TPA: hypothetical protein VH575_11365 [Gemmataceae bacterium]